MDVIELTQKMVRTPSLSGNEEQMANLVTSTMTELGYSHIFKDRLGSVVGLFGDKDEKPIILLDGHMDVVPPDGKWQVDPFDGNISQGRLFGRGSSDMKGGLAAAIIGAAEAAATGKLRKTVAVSATVMEESIEGLALGEVCDNVEPELVVICESTALELFAAQRGRMEIFLRIFGEPQHTGEARSKKNAIILASQITNSLVNVELPDDKSYGQAVLVPTDIISDPYPSKSTTPNYIQLRFDRRTIYGENPELIISKMVDTVRKHTVLPFEIVLGNDPITAYTGVTISPERNLLPFYTDPNHLLVKTIIESMRNQNLPIRFGNVFPGCTNGCASAGARNIPSVIIGPGWEAHTPDESIPIDEIIKAKDLYKDILLRIAGE